MSEEKLSPWERAHQKRLKSIADKKAAAIAAEKKAKRQAFLRRLKLTRTPAKIEREVESKALKPKREKKTIENPIFPVFKKLWLPLVFFLALFTAAAYYISPLSRVGKVTLTGNKVVSDYDITGLSQIQRKATVLGIWLDRSKIASQIKAEEPYINTISLNIKFPNSLEFNTVEYQPAIYLKIGSSYLVILQNGYIDHSTVVNPKKLKTIPVVTKLTEDQASQLAVIVSGLKPALAAKIKTVTLAPTPATADYLQIDLSDGNQVRVALSDMADKFPYYSSIAPHLAGKGKQVVDMEIGLFSSPYAQYIQEYANYTSSSSSSSSNSSSSNTESSSQ